MTALRSTGLLLIGLLAMQCSAPPTPARGTTARVSSATSTTTGSTRVTTGTATVDLGTMGSGTVEFTETDNPETAGVDADEVVIEARDMATHVSRTFAFDEAAQRFAIGDGSTRLTMSFGMGNTFTLNGMPATNEELNTALGTSTLLTGASPSIFATVLDRLEDGGFETGRNAQTNTKAKALAETILCQGIFFNNGWTNPRSGLRSFGPREYFCSCRHYQVEICPQFDGTNVEGRTFEASAAPCPLVRSMAGNCPADWGQP